MRVVKNSIAQIAPHYTMKRQLDDYYTKFYNPLAERFRIISADNADIARRLAAWKEDVAAKWDSVSVVSTETCDNMQDGNIVSGTEFTVKVVIDEAGLNDAIGVDMVVVSTIDGIDSLYKVFPMNLMSHEGNLHTFAGTVAMDLAGTFKVAYRMYPRHKLLAHRQDFAYVRWFN